MMTTTDTDRAEGQAKAQLESIREMVAALEKADASGTEEERDEARQTIEEDALSVEVRSGWHEPGGDSDPGEYCILLCTGGPAVRVIGRLGAFSEPESARLQYQDWFTEWQELVLSHEDYETLLTYARTFYFGCGSHRASGNSHTLASSSAQRRNRQVYSSKEGR